MSNTQDKQKTVARESAGLKDDCGTQSPQGTPRSCNRLCASLSNTAPAKYIRNQNTTPLRCSVDSLYVSYQGELTSDTEELLEVLKTQAQDEDPLISSEAYLSISDHKFEVKSKGQGRFSYVLDDNWFHIQLSSQKAKKLPLAHVQIKSELLTFNDLDSITDHLDQIINRLGVVEKVPSISRLDLCIDFTCNEKFNLQDITINQWRTRASQTDQFHMHKALSGWRIGKGDLMARIYNKSLEIKKSKKDYLLPLWEQVGWDGQTDVWRVEFQFRRQFLSNVGVLNPSQINQSSPSLWKYASSHWLQLVIPNKDSNSARWPVHKAWKELSSACTNTECRAVRKVTKKRIPNDQILFVNGISAISSFMAREGISDLGEALGEFLHRAEMHHSANTDLSMANYLFKKALEKSKRYNTIVKE